jgi:hypothetical protein
MLIYKKAFGEDSLSEPEAFWFKEKNNTIFNVSFACSYFLKKIT